MFCLLSLCVRPYLTPIRPWWRCLWWCMIWEKCPPAIRHSCGREPSQSQSNASSTDITTKSRPHWVKDELSATSSIWGQYRGMKLITMSAHSTISFRHTGLKCSLFALVVCGPTCLFMNMYTYLNKPPEVAWKGVWKCSALLKSLLKQVFSFGILKPPPGSYFLVIKVWLLSTWMRIENSKAVRFIFYQINVPIFAPLKTKKGKIVQKSEQLRKTKMFTCRKNNYTWRKYKYIWIKCHLMVIFSQKDLEFTVHVK